MMRKDRDHVGRVLGLCLLLCFLSVIFSFFNSVLGPTLGAIAELHVRTMIHRSVNEAVAEEFPAGRTKTGLMGVQSSSDGKVTMIQADMTEVNQITASLTGKIQKKVASLGEERISVPLGNVLGSQILAQMGPSMELRVIPVGTAEVGFKTDFESSAINQTRHRIYLEVRCTARIMAPFSVTKIETENEILLAETVIVGDTPQSYVFVPEESILDVID
ncbi:MAG: sporulation protein YunB [Firmicutes bacterium]|nr:sporulation protein YunB [Bacillota bacterium]